MPRVAFKCTVEFDIYLVTCPGTRHLHDRNMIYLTACVLGQSNRTKSVFASFPLVFNERMYFERTFTNAREPSHVVEMLEDEHVLLELVQYSDVYRGGKILARLEQPAREFLYPAPTLTGKDGAEREILLNRSAHFNGIDPKMEFSTTTVIQETTVQGSSYREHTAARQQESDPESDSSTETEEEVIVHPTPIHHNHSMYVKEHHCVCECPRRPENDGSVVVRSRSVSPRRPRMASSTRQPPFKAGKADESIISRRNFVHSQALKRSRRLPLPAEGDPMPCSGCRVPHKDCIVCQAYYKVFGKDFLKHRFTTNSHKRTLSTPAYTTFASEPRHRARARIPGEEPLYQSRAYSAPLTRVRRSRMFSSDEDPVRTTSADDDIHERVDRLITKYSPTVKVAKDSYNEDSDSDDSLFSLQELRSEIDEARMESLDRSFEDPENPPLGTRLDRSVTVPLSEDQYWSNRKSQFTGKSHRAVFEESLQDIYHGMYQKASQRY